MARVKSPSARKHRKFLKEARGFKQSRSRRIQVAKEAVLHAGQHAYIGRKNRKRDLRRLWITRLGIAAKESGLNYNKLISSLKVSKIEIDRKILSDIAITDSTTFKKIVEHIQSK